MSSSIARNATRFDQLTVWSQRFRWSLKFHGMVGTAIGGLAGIIKPFGQAVRFRKWCRRYKDSCFDTRFRVSTAHCVAPEDLDMAPDRMALAIEYAATSPISFCQVLTGLKIDYRQYTFVDLGSGKGRVLLLASEFPFREVLGVEIAASLHDIAMQNIAAYTSRSRSCWNVRSVCRDVTTFVPPDGPVVFFLYNPFQGEVLEQTLDNMRKSFEMTPRPMYIVYHNPVQRALMDQASYLSEIESDDKDWALYRFVSP